jgi:hypothetical protein
LVALRPASVDRKLVVAVSERYWGSGAATYVAQQAMRHDPRAGQRIAEHLKVLACPDMGTGVQRVSPETCTRQVRAAIDEHLEGRVRLPNSWAEANDRHQLLYTDEPTRF